MIRCRNYTVGSCWRFQRLPPAHGSKDNSLQVMELSGQTDLKLLSTHPFIRFLDGFPDPSQFAADKLTYYSSKPQRPSDSSRPRQRLLLSVDVHPNPGPTTKYPCSQCHKSWGEIFVQSLFWLGTFGVFWSSKRSGVSTN